MQRSLLTNGVETAYSLDGASGAPVILFANGLGMGLTMWSPLREMLGADYRTLRYDLRGHGQTPPMPGDYSLAMLAADVAALLDGLDLPVVHLIGTSLGAMIGMQLAIVRPDRLASLTLCATTATAPREIWRDRIATARSQGLGSQAGPVVDRWFTPGFHASRPDIAQRMRDMLLATSLDGYAGCAAAIRDMDLADHLGRIRTPTLVLAGEDDLATPVTEQAFIAARIPGATLVNIKDAAHMPTIEQPERCHAAIESFLARCTPRAADASRAYEEGGP